MDGGLRIAVGLAAAVAFMEIWAGWVSGAFMKERSTGGGFQ
jgi:hypothetical protein